MVLQKFRGELQMRRMRAGRAARAASVGYSGGGSRDPTSASSEP